MPPKNENGWKDHKEMVLHELKRQADDHEKCSMDVWKEIRDFKVELAIIKVKAGLIGLIGGAIPVIVGLGIWFLRSGMN